MIPWNYKNEKNIFIQREENGVPYLSFAALEETGLVVNGFSTRLGGASKGKYATMNFAWNKGDDPADVLENYTRMAKALGVDRDRMVASQQTHTTHIHKVTEKERGMGFTKPLEYTDIDGLMTNVPGLVLVTSYADCVPLYFVDPVKKAVALSHSGWKGTAHQMGKVTVEAMKREYGCDPKDILACVGPSICQDCYEVSEDVFMQIEAIMPENAGREFFYQKENGRYQLNLWKVNEQILQNAGILKEHICVTDLCTCCNPSIFFSHRASGGKRGNLSAFLGIRG